MISKWFMYHFEGTVYSIRKKFDFFKFYKSEHLNRVEHRIAFLRQELAGLMLILPHDYFISLLDNHVCTINVHLEKSKFEFTGKVCAENMEHCPYWHLVHATCD